MCIFPQTVNMDKRHQKIYEEFQNNETMSAIDQENIRHVFYARKRKHGSQHSQSGVSGQQTSPDSSSSSRGWRHCGPQPKQSAEKLLQAGTQGVTSAQSSSCQHRARRCQVSPAVAAGEGNSRKKMRSQTPRRTQKKLIRVF